MNEYIVTFTCKANAQSEIIKLIIIRTFQFF